MRQQASLSPGRPTWKLFMRGFPMHVCPVPDADARRRSGVPSPLSADARRYLPPPGAQGAWPLRIHEQNPIVGGEPLMSALACGFNLSTPQSARV